MYDHYIAVDWSQKTMAVAHFCAKSAETRVIEVGAELKVLKAFVTGLSGRRILTIEEGNQAQWLFVELNECVDELIICDPYRNHLLKEGTKTDRTDAEKLLKLLRAGLLKPVFHADDDLIYLRRLASGYEDLVRSGVRIKNQMKALLAARSPVKDPHHQFVLEGLRTQLATYEAEHKRYRNKLLELTRKNRAVRILSTVPGIGPVGSVKIASRIVFPTRFQSKGHYLSYCGLIRLAHSSGGKSYGQRLPRHSRQLRAVFKTAAMVIINDADCSLRAYYDKKLSDGLADFQARHALARRVALLAFGVMKRDEEFNVKRLKN